MTEYLNFGVNLTKGQARKIINAHKSQEGVVLRLKKTRLHGEYKIPLTKNQINKIENAAGDVQLNLSSTQLKHMEKTGGFLPLAALIPIIAGVVSGVGSLAGGISSMVSTAKSTSEQARHNRAIEEQQKTTATTSGSGVLADTVGYIPLIGGPIKTILEKFGLGINNGGCIKCGKYVVGKGLYLSPKGDIVGQGLFLADNHFLE